MPDAFRIQRSKATEPLFFEAPYPEQSGWVPSPYQHAGVEYRIQKDHGLFGDVPGLGKTCEAILTGNALEAKRTLVLCPASLRLNWEREVWHWSVLEDVSTYPVLKSSDGISLTHDYVIASYNALSNRGIYDAIMEGTWDHLILDEAHFLKSHNANVRTSRTLGGEHREEYWDGIISRVGHITALSGTPMPNGPVEVYNLVRMLDWDAIECMSLESFRDYYYELGWGFAWGFYEEMGDDGEVIVKHGRHRKQVRNVPRHLKDLQDRLRGSIMVRRQKDQVFDQLPPVTLQPVPIVGDAHTRRLRKSDHWDAAEKFYDFDPALFDTSIPVDGQISTARKEVGLAKMHFVAAYCNDLLQTVDKLVVSAWHHEVLDFLREKLHKHGLVYMDGSTTPAQKQEAVDAFQTDPKTRIILGQQLPLGLGWTLTAAQDVVFAEIDWVPGNNVQLMDRINRRGQSGNYTLGHIPFIPDTLEEKVFGRAVQKAIATHAALDA